MSRYKVIVWGTGFVGKMVLDEILDRPDLELVGVIVNDPAKDGMDVGDLVGRAPIGLAATRDADAVLARDADAVAYFGPTAALAAQNIDNMSRALRAGKNVVDTSMTPWVYPKACPPRLTEEIEKACREGGVTHFTTGIDPGFANDLFPLTLIGLCGHVDRVRILEILDYASYTGDYAPTGLGRPVEEAALLENPKILIFGWGHTIYTIADALDVKLDQVDTTWKKWAATEPIEYANGVIEPGCTAAIRFEIRGWVGGEPRIVIEHVNRITNRAAPDWPRAKIEENDCYRIEIEGNPNIVQETAFRGEKNGDPNAGGCLATGMRAINAIPAVCDADPGMISMLDLPLIPGRGVLRG